MAPARKAADEAVNDEAMPAETPETVLAWVRVERRITVDASTNRKVDAGSNAQVPLSLARLWVKQGMAIWTDPRPDL